MTIKLEYHLCEMCKKRNFCHWEHHLKIMSEDGKRAFMLSCNEFVPEQRTMEKVY